MKLTVEQLREKGFVEMPSGAFIKQYSNNQTELVPKTLVATSPPKKRIRQSSKPRLNKLETEWLEVLKLRFGESIIRSQSIRFELATGLWYKPDHVVFIGGLDSQDRSIRAFECKGPHAFRGGFENLKMAARAWPFIRFTLVWKENGQWKEQSVYP